MRLRALLHRQIKRRLEIYKQTENVEHVFAYVCEETWGKNASGHKSIFKDANISGHYTGHQGSLLTDNPAAFLLRCIAAHLVRGPSVHSSWRIFHTPSSELIQQLSAVAPEPGAPLESLYAGLSAVHGHTSALAPEAGAPLEALPGGTARQFVRCTVAEEPKKISQCTSTSDCKVKSGAWTASLRPRIVMDIRRPMLHSAQ